MQPNVTMQFYFYVTVFATNVYFLFLITHLKKILDADWLTGVQFKHNCSAKMCNLVQLQTQIQF
jgi:hypothetical protein